MFNSGRKSVGRDRRSGGRGHGEEAIDAARRPGTAENWPHLHSLLIFTHHTPPHTSLAWNVTEAIWNCSHFGEMLSFSLAPQKHIAPSPQETILHFQSIQIIGIWFKLLRSPREALNLVEPPGKNSTRRRFQNSDLPKRGIDVDSGMQEYGATEWMWSALSECHMSATLRHQREHGETHRPNSLFSTLTFMSRWNRVDAGEERKRPISFPLSLLRGLQPPDAWRK